MRRIFHIILMLGVAVTVYSQTDQQKPTQAPVVDKQINTNEIFDEIMQSLPQSVRAEIDSASRGGKNTTEHSAPAADKLSPHSPKDSPSGPAASRGLDKLPDDVRKRVEKAMTEIDQRQKQRQMQFKESRKID